MKSKRLSADALYIRSLLETEFTNTELAKAEAYITLSKDDELVIIIVTETYDTELDEDGMELDGIVEKSRIFKLGCNDINELKRIYKLVISELDDQRWYSEYCTNQHILCLLDKTK